MTENEYTTQIEGVLIKSLCTFPDDRGFFREILRHSDDVFSEGSFAQWSHSKMTKDVVKAWHFHHLQTDWWYLALGVIEAVLYDNRAESKTYKNKLQLRLSGENCPEEQNSSLVRIPPGVLHGLKVISDSAHLIYVTSHVYDPEDEGRIPFNDPDIPHDWGDNVITVPRDHTHHIPPYERALVRT